MKTITKLAIIATLVGSIYNGLSQDPGDTCGGFWTGTVWADQGTYGITFDQTQTTMVQRGQGYGKEPANPCKGEVYPVAQIVAVNSSQETHKSWQVSGSIGYGAFGVSGQFGEDVTFTVGSGCTVTINQWCQYAHPVAGIQYDTETMILTCSSGGNTVTGTNVKNYQTYCDASDSGTLPGCKTTCP